MVLSEDRGDPSEWPRPAPRYPELAGHVALVTGGSSGIGRAIVGELARQGVQVAFTYLSAPGRDEGLKAGEVVRQVEERGCQALAMETDGADSASASQAVERVLAEFGSLEILVNNAGISDDAVIWKMGETQWDRVLAVNLKQAFNYIRAVAPIFRERESGKIVNVASINAMRGKFGLANYSASKAGLLGLTRVVAVELGRYHVNVNAVAPGLILTPLTGSLAPEVIEGARQETVFKRLGEPEDVAHVVVFLCTEGARHITGEVIRVDGGQLIS